LGCFTDFADGGASGAVGAGGTGVETVEDRAGGRESRTLRPEGAGLVDTGLVVAATVDVASGGVTFDGRSAVRRAVAGGAVLDTGGAAWREPALRARFTVVDEDPVDGRADDGRSDFSDGRPGTVDEARRADVGGVPLLRTRREARVELADPPLEAGRAPLPDDALACEAPVELVEFDSSGASAGRGSDSTVARARSLGAMTIKCTRERSATGVHPPVAAAVADASPTRTVTVTVVPVPDGRWAHVTSTPPFTTATRRAAGSPPTTPARAAPSAAVRARAASTASWASPASAIAAATPMPSTIAPNGTT
jgi:hypothetical protein